MVVPAAVEVDAAFLNVCMTSLGEVAALGFQPRAAAARGSLFELSVSSRADSLPRLAAMLRAIAAQPRLRRQRALSFDPDRMLELAATALRCCGRWRPPIRSGASGWPARCGAISHPLRRSASSDAAASAGGPTPARGA